ncbi:MAG: hypothetical protein ACRCVI_00395 [Mycoplasmoidaceae bacterium]
MARKNKAGQFDNNENYQYYNDQSINGNDFDLIFNKIVEVSNSGNQQLFNFISSVEGNLSNQIADLKNILANNPQGRTAPGNATNASFWPNYTIQQPVVLPVEQPISYQQIIPQRATMQTVDLSHIQGLSNQFENIRREINENKELIRSIASKSLSEDAMAVVIDTNNKNADQLFSALNYLQNNILASVDNQSAINYDFGEALALLREEIYASQNSLLEAIHMNPAQINDGIFHSLYEEITKVNDENTQNLFNYISVIEESLKENILASNQASNMQIHDRISGLESKIYESHDINADISNSLMTQVDQSTHGILDYVASVEDNIHQNILATTQESSFDIHSRISDLENKIYETADINTNINYNLMDRVDESSMMYHDMLSHLREELLDSNYQNFNEIVNVAAQLRDELLQNDYQNANSLYEHTNLLQEESSSKLNYLNDQIETIKEMLFNLNDLIGINNDRFRTELSKIHDSSSFQDSKYRDELNSIKELLKEKNRLLEDANIPIENKVQNSSIDRQIEKLLGQQPKPPDNNTTIDDEDIEEIPWDDWEEDEEGEYMENYRSNNRRRSSRIDESKLDMIYERVEQINYEINAKLYELEQNIFNLINDRDNQLNYKIIETSKMNEKLILDSIETLSSESEENNKNMKKEFLERISEIKEEFLEKNKETINGWDNKLKASIDEMNTISSNIIDEMINSQKRFDELFMSIDKRLNGFEQELMFANENQMNIYGENSNNFEHIYATLDKFKNDVKKTHLMWDENNDKIETLKENITKNTKEIVKLNISDDYKDIVESLSQIELLKKNSEELKLELTEIKNVNAEIEKKLTSDKESMEDKISVLYNDFQYLMDSFDEKIQYDIHNVADDLHKEFSSKTEEIPGLILDETTKKISDLESQIGESSNKLELKINEVNDEINDILNNLDNKIQRETEEKLQALYQETLELINNVQMQNERARIEIDKTNEYLLDRIEESNNKILKLEKKSYNVSEEKILEIEKAIEEMRASNKEAAEKIQAIHEDWITNNSKLQILEEVLINQSLEIQSLSSMSKDAFDDSYDKIQILYDNEAKIKEEINLIQSTNNLLETKLSEEKEKLETKINDVSTNIDTMISDLDEKVTEKTDSKIVKLYEETISMIDQLKQENKNSYEEISLVNESVSLNLFELNSKVAELEHFSKLDLKDDPKFHDLFATINEIKDSSIQTREDVEVLIESWNINNEKITSLEKILHERSEEILLLTQNTGAAFDDSYERIEDLYKSEESIKNEIQAINKVNEELEKKLLDEKRNLDEKIKILNEELDTKILDTETKLTTATDDKIKELNEGLEEKLITLHNEVMNLISDLNESNQELNKQIGVIENDTIQSFFSVDAKMNELAELHKSISEHDPRYIEIKNLIADVQKGSDEQSKNITELQTKLNKNIQRNKSLRKILVAQSEEIQFIANSSNEAFTNSFDRIQELFNSEKTIKEEIEKIHEENELIKEDIAKEKAALSDRLEEASVSIEDKLNTKLMDLHFELLEQINSIHYENVANVEKIANLELLFGAEINANKSKIKELELIVNQVPEEDPKFAVIFTELAQLKEVSEVSIERMQENYDLISANNENIHALKGILDKQGEDIIYLSQQQEHNYVDVHDRIQELYASEKEIKEEIDKIYLENDGLKKVILSETTKNKELLNTKITEFRSMLETVEENFTTQVAKEKVALEEMIRTAEENITSETDQKISDLKDDMGEKLEILYQQTLNMITEITDSNQILMEEIGNLDNYTRITMMTIDSKISELDFLINQIPEEDPKFQNFMQEIESLKQFHDLTAVEIDEIHKAWMANNKKLGSLEEILLSQSEELKLLSASNEEVWNLSFDRIQELYESENHIKEEIENIFRDNYEIRARFNEEKDKLEGRINDINSNVLVEINKTREEVLTELDTKVNEINSNIEEKVTQLYTEITNIINEVHSFNEMNSMQIVDLKDEVNNFVIDVNNRIFEINETLNILPEEDPKFKALYDEVDQLRKDNDLSMYEVQKIYEAWKANNQKLSSLEEILLTQSEELKLLSASNEEVWNLSFDRIQELYESENHIKEEIELIYEETGAIKAKLSSHKDKMKERIATIDNEIRSKINSLEFDLNEKINTEIDNLSASIASELNERMDTLLNQTLELVESVRLANEDSSMRFEKINDEIRHELDICNQHLIFLEQKMNEDNQFTSLEFENRINEIKELNVNVNNEIEKNKKLWLLNNFKLNSFKELLNSQTREIESLNDEYEPSEELKRRIEDLLEIDQSLKGEIDEIINSNSKIEKNLNHQKTILLNKVNELVEESKDELNYKFNEKIEGVFNQSMEMINIVNDSIHENKEAIHIVHDLINNNYEIVNEKIQKLIVDVNSKFDEKIGLEKINELAVISNHISKEIARIQKDWKLNSEKLKSLETILHEEMQKQNADIHELDYTTSSMQENLIDLLELDGSITNEIEALKSKNLILEDNLFTFKKNFEDNIREIINQIDEKINSLGANINESVSSRSLFADQEIVKSIENIVYAIVSKEINKLPYKNELLKLTHDDEVIKTEIKEVYKKLSEKNFKISQMIFDEIWNCNLRIESLIEDVMVIASNQNIDDLKKYVDTSATEIKQLYNSWSENNQRITSLEKTILDLNDAIKKLGLNPISGDVDKTNEKIDAIKAEISSIEASNEAINNQITNIIHKQEISTENLHQEILAIMNDMDVKLHQKIEEKLKTVEFPIDPNMKDKEEIKKVVLKYAEEIISSELKNFIQLFEENNSELNKSHSAWLANNQRISLLEDIVLEHEKGIRTSPKIKTFEPDTSLSSDEKASIEKLISNHKKRLL